MKRLALAVVFLSCLTAPARAGIDEGLAAYERGDYATALQEWAPLANQGDAEAQYFLSRIAPAAVPRFIYFGDTIRGQAPALDRPKKNGGP